MENIVAVDEKYLSDDFAEELKNRIEELSRKLQQEQGAEVNEELVKEYEELWKDGIARVSTVAQYLKISLLVDNPFLGSILTQLCFIRYSAEVSTACTDGEYIIVNPFFLAKYSTACINFVLLHEIYHVVLGHPMRTKKLAQIKEIDHEVMNQAQDYIINYLITSDAGSGDVYGRSMVLLEGGLLLLDKAGGPVDLTEMNAETLYEQLMEGNKKQQGEQSEQQSKQSGQGGQRGEMLRSLPNTSEDTQSIAEQIANDVQPDSNVLENSVDENGEPFDKTKTKSEYDSFDTKLAQVFKDLRAMGYSPTGSFNRLVESHLRKTKVRWDIFLKRFLSSKVSDESSYDTPNRKYLCHDLIFPGAGGESPALDDIFCFFDVSGSIDEEEMLAILNNAYTISQKFNATLSIACWSTSISNVHNGVEPEDFEKIVGQLEVESGGTDVNGVYQYLEQKKPKCAAVVIFTDGMFTVPETVPLRLFRKTLVALFDTTSYDQELERMGRIVSIGEK